MSGGAPSSEPTVFERVGGLEAFERLVDAFYGRVEHDPLLRPMYPDDLGPGKEGLTLFLAQYWGGGPLYSADRGHPRLRMRHAPFPITPEAALRWAELMTASIVEMRFPSDVEQQLLTYVAQATPTLVNRMSDAVRPPSPAPPRPRSQDGDPVRPAAGRDTTAEGDVP